ncbi:hypothetical protein BH24DEI2_BH24DEI2_10100 [soil metagenome]
MFRESAKLSSVPDMQALAARVSADPFLFYTLVAASFLTVVSLGSGWARGDFLAVARPQGLLRVTVAVLIAFLIVLLADTLQPLQSPASSGFWLETLRGSSRFPLYVVTLAYGPSAGLLAAGLFAAFATSSNLPGLPEAVLALELVVLGWFALAPSPRTARWAGPLGALLAYFLAWATGGAALLQAVSGDGATLAAHLSYHQAVVPGVLLSMALLFAIGPGTYKRLFPHSRIAPKLSATADSRDAPSEILAVNRNAGSKTGEQRGSGRGRRATDQPAASQKRVGRRKDDPVNPVADLGDSDLSDSDLRDGYREAGARKRVSGFEPDADAELVAPRDGLAPSSAAPALRDAPHDVES